MRAPALTATVHAVTALRRTVPTTLKKAAEVVEGADDPRRLYAWVGIVTGAGALLWLGGWSTLRALGQGTEEWDTVWALTGVSFVFGFLPLPAITSALLLALRSDWILGTFGVLGAAAGGTVAAGLLLALGHTGREHLKNRATKSKRARKLLEWSKRFATKWTYVGVTVLLLPQFIPRAVVLYAAVLAKLKAIPFLAAVFVGTFLRNLLVLAAFSFIP
jgi:membrane protein YqaA with SNARE-associated domain